MCSVETSVGAWNTGGRFFSDVTLAYGTGTFGLLYSSGSALSGSFHFSRRPIVPNGVLYLCKSHFEIESWKANANQKA